MFLSPSLFWEWKSRPSVPKQHVAGSNKKVLEAYSGAFNSAYNIPNSKMLTCSQNKLFPKRLPSDTSRKEAKSQIDRSPKITHPRWRPWKIARGQRLVPVPHMPWQWNSAETDKSNLGTKLPNKMWIKLFIGRFFALFEFSANQRALF